MNSDLSFNEAFPRIHPEEDSFNTVYRHLQTAAKPRWWPADENIHPIKKEMEPFFEEHLSKIQDLVDVSFSTVHFPKNPSKRALDLKKISPTPIRLSFRLTPEGDIWLLLDRDRTYSPTLRTMGYKKNITENAKAIYKSLPQDPHAPIVPILDCAETRFAHPYQQKISIIMPFYRSTVGEAIAQLTAEKQNFDRIKVSLSLYCLFIDQWVCLARDYKILHPDYHTGNMVIDLLNGQIIGKFIDFDDASSDNFLNDTPFDQKIPPKSNLERNLGVALDSMLSVLFYDIVEKSIQNNDEEANILNLLIPLINFMVPEEKHRMIQMPLSLNNLEKIYDLCFENIENMTNCSLENLLEKVEAFSKEIKQLIQAPS